jgi:hypothetical protein
VKQRTVNTRPERLRGRDISELAVMVQFGELVVAIAAERVSRIAMADEATAVTGATPSVRIGDAVLPAWDLGKLLGLAAPAAAWLVMTTGDDPAAPKIAVATGPCLAVAAHGQVSPLPAGVVSAPPAAVLGVFVTDPALRERGLGHLGVRIDPMHLIGPSGLTTARRGER